MQEEDTWLSSTTNPWICLI